MLCSSATGLFSIVLFLSHFWFFETPWKILWRRKWQLTPVFLPGISHRWRSLTGYNPRGHKEPDTTEQLHFLSMDCSTPGFPVLHYLLQFAQTQVHRVNDAIQPSHSLSPLLLLPSDLPSIRVFPNELALPIRRPKYWNFIFSISPSIGYPGVISFRITNHNLRNLILLGLSAQCCVPGSWNEWHLRSQQEWPQSAQSFLVT